MPTTPTGADRPPATRRLLDALPITVCALDLDGRITAANAPTAPLAPSGTSLDDQGTALLGRSITDVIGDPTLRARVTQAMRTLADGDVPAFRWELPSKSGEDQRIFLVSVTATREDGAVTGFFYTAVDITPSHRAREALIEAGLALSHVIDLGRTYEEIARQVRRAFAASGVVLAMVDDETAAFEVAHRWGFPGDGGDADALSARLTPDWLEALAGSHVVVRDHGDRQEVTTPLTSAEGVLGAITLATRAFGNEAERAEAERVLGVLAAQAAVAVERAWLVSRVESKRRLEAIGEVAAGVAHELRNPLFGISSAAQLLRFRARADPVVEKNVGRILGEVQRLNRMVTSLLDFGRPAAVHLQAGDPDALWNDVVESEAARLLAKRLRVVRERPDEPIAAQLDPEQLTQVFINVLQNAIDHAPEGSILTVASQRSPSGGWRGRVVNGGPPIPPEVLPHVFEFFYSTKPGGTGIGLALCQRIVDEHGGSIGIDSTSDEGTVVTITLPQVDAA